MDYDRYIDNPPEWVWDIIDKHDLALRTDCPRSAATVLLHDAADLLKELSLTTFREQAISADTRRSVAECKAMITDAEKLFPICPSQPESGSITRNAAGAYVWSPE